MATTGPLLRLLLPLLLHVCCVGGADLYETLEVSRGASDAEIRQAYRKLAKDLHPDRNPSPDAAARFSEVAAAYEVLGDDAKRKTYTLLGSMGPPNGKTDPRGSYRDEFKTALATLHVRLPVARMRLLFSMFDDNGAVPSHTQCPEPPMPSVLG